MLLGVCSGVTQSRSATIHFPKELVAPHCSQVDPPRSVSVLGEQASEFKQDPGPSPNRLVVARVSAV